MFPGLLPKCRQLLSELSRVPINAWCTQFSGVNSVISGRKRTKFVSSVHRSSSILMRPSTFRSSILQIIWIPTCNFWIMLLSANKQTDRQTDGRTAGGENRTRPPPELAEIINDRNVICKVEAVTGSGVHRRINSAWHSRVCSSTNITNVLDKRAAI